MPSIGDRVEKIRSKNAGPFWVTIDIFCGSVDSFETVRGHLTAQQIAGLFNAEENAIKHFEIPDLNVVKVSFPRPAIQGTLADRDMHGAGWAELVAELPWPEAAAQSD